MVCDLSVKGHHEYKYNQANIVFHENKITRYASKIQR